MTREELQKMINQSDKHARQMREIGQCYLRGDVLKDEVAAEGWLMKAIDSEDREEALIAMEILIKEILKKEQVLSDGDYLQMKKEYATAKGEKKKELELLLSFATDKQKGLKDDYSLLL